MLLKRIKMHKTPKISNTDSLTNHSDPLCQHKPCMNEETQSPTPYPSENPTLSPSASPTLFRGVMRKKKQKKSKRLKEERGDDDDEALLKMLETQRKKESLSKKNGIAFYVNKDTKQLLDLEVELVDDHRNDLVLTIHDTLNQLKCGAVYTYYSVIDQAVRSGMDFLKILVSTKDLIQSINDDEGPFAVIRAANWWISQIAEGFGDRFYDHLSALFVNATREHQAMLAFMKREHRFFKTENIKRIYSRSGPPVPAAMPAMVALETFFGFFSFYFQAVLRLKVSCLESTGYQFGPTLTVITHAIFERIR